MTYIFIILISILLLSIEYIFFKKQIHQYKQKIEKEYIEKNKKHLEDLARRDIEHLLKTQAEVEADLKKRIEAYHQLQDAYGKLNQQLQEQQQLMATYEANQTSQVHERIAAYEMEQRAVVDTRIAIEAKEKQKLAEAALAEKIAQIALQTETARTQLGELEDNIKEYSEKQAAINEAIRRQREAEEQKDFYRVCIPEEFLDDITALQTVKRNLKKPEIVDKIIYDNYISKPVLEMIKRVLQNSTCSGIYKITCLKTGEIYIGKSTDIKSRWQQHCKTAFNCGTIASSLLHTKMKQYGIENFTFELMERVPKDQLSEREKFYIQFYQTKEVGLNERNG